MKRDSPGCVPTLTGMSLVLSDLNIEQFQPRLVRATITAVSGDYASARIDANGHTSDATVPRSHWYPRVPLTVGESHVFAQLSDDAHPLLSVTDKRVPGLVLESWIPELRTGDIRVLRVSRIPGARAKIAVAATREGVDPIEVSVGGRAQNMTAYSAALHGERAEMIAFHKDPDVFLRHAIGQSIVDIETTSEGTIVWVPDHVLDAAVGKHALNAILAHRITRIRFRIQPVSERPPTPPSPVAPAVTVVDTPCEGDPRLLGDSAAPDSDLVAPLAA